MKIVIATPLYPPDIAPPAPYVKELARRLAHAHHVTIVAYGSLPEQVPGVQIIAVPKNRLLPVRLTAYTYQLLRAAWQADVVYEQNGASVELPAIAVAILTRTPFILGLTDMSAHERAKRSRMLGMIERIAIALARKTIKEMPHRRPEILPFGPKPEQALAAYEASWSTHLTHLEHVWFEIKKHART